MNRSAGLQTRPGERTDMAGSETGAPRFMVPMHTGRAWRLSMNLAEEFLTQSRQDAKKRESNFFASWRLCVSHPSPFLWFMVPLRANSAVGALHEPGRDGFHSVPYFSRPAGEEIKDAVKHVPTGIMCFKTQGLALGAFSTVNGGAG